MSTTPVSLRTRQHQEGAWARLSRARRGGPPRAPIAAIFVAVAAMVALAIGPSSALADSPIQNPFFKDPSASGANSGTDLSGWATSAPGQVISTWCYAPGGINAFPCVPEQGTTIPVLGLAGAPTPPQAFMVGGQGTPGVANKTFRSTDIYSGDTDWLAGNPFGKTVIPQQSNYALIPTSCQNNQPAPNTLSQSFYAYKDQVLTGFSFFTSQDWVPDSGKVTITPPGGSPQPLYQARITGDGDQAPAGAWDHPVPPTVHQLNNGTWVQPHGEPADSTWISQHQAGVSGTPWTRWTYRFPQDGTYTLTATANESTDPAFPVDCNMPSMMGLQFQTPTPIKDGLTINVTPTSATYGDAQFSVAGKVSVTPSRGNQPYTGTPTFSTTDPDCTVTSGGTVTVKRVGNGVCNVTVRAPGDYFHFAAETKNLPITINPRALHVDAPDLTKTFGSPNPDPTPQATLRQSDLVGTDTLATVLDLNNVGQPNCSIDGSAGPDVGSYAGTVHCGPGTLSLASSGGNQPNYVLQSGRDGMLTVTPADQTIILPPLADRTYGDSDVDPSGMASSGLPVGYVSATDDVCTITPNGKIHITHAGTCAIIASQGGNNDYNAAQSVAGTFNVAKADQTISFGPLADKGFGDGDFTVNSSASSQLPVTYSTSTPDICAVDPNTGVVHILIGGDCSITVTQPGNGDYNAAPNVTQNFHIATAGQTVTFPPMADKTYGDQNVDPGATASSGLPVSYTAHGNCTIVNGMVQITGAGSCTVTASQGGDQRYSSAPPVSRTFQIAKAPLTVKADDQSKAYGDSNPNFTYGLNGFVNGDTQGSVTSGSATCSSNADQGSGAGTYGISCSQGTLQAGANYDLRFVDGTLTVNKVPLTVKTDDELKTYGDPNPSFTYSLNGFVNGDTQATATSGSASCSSNAGQGAGVGSYAIDCSQGSLTASNYSINYSQGTLTVSKAPLTVKADDKSRTYGDQNPNFTYSLNGLINGDTTSGSAICSSNADQGSGAGTYGISCNQGSLQAGQNYNLRFVDGTLTVAKAPLTINVNDATRQYGSPNPTPSYSLSGFVNGDTRAAATSGDAACSVGPGPQANVGTYPGGITCDQGPLSTPNYSVRSGTATLTITKANQTINFPPQSRSYGDPDFDPATASSGLQVSYTSSTTNVCTIVNGKVHIVALGTCKVTASQPGNGNYNAATSVTQSFTIGKGNQTITFPQPSDARYGDPNFDPGASASSGLAVSYTSSTSSVCKISSGKIQIVAPGTCTITASQSGNGSWNAAQSVTRSFTVRKDDQTITFPQPPDKTVGDSDFAPGATADSGLAVTYSSSTPAVCTIVNGKIHLVTAGACTIVASQAGTANYNAAPDVSRTFNVNPKTVPLCTNKCESVLVNPSPGAGATVTAGQTMTIGYTDDSPIPTSGSLAPTAVLNDGRSLPVTVTPTSGLPYNYVTNYKQDRTNKNQALLSFQLPANLTPGPYSILITAYDGDGDVDVWNWPVIVGP
jgi:hypothetical protein